MLESISDFHFLRPLWLLLIPVAILFTYLAWKYHQHIANGWKRSISPTLLKHLISEEQTSKHKKFLIGLSLLWVLAGLALAGPTWQKLPQQIHQQDDALVIILDLSISTLATDIKPSRIERAKLKILDLLNKHRDGLTALIVYSGDAHTVVPLTEDTSTIKSLIPTLNPLLMPAPGSRVDLAFEKAYELFTNSHIKKGRILLITDDIALHHGERISQQINRNFDIGILVVGTENGAPIPLPQQGFLKDQSGTIVIPKVEEHYLRNIAERWEARISRLTIDDQDLSYLVPDHQFKQLAKDSPSDRYFDHWKEMGPWLLLLLLPACALFFRRGLILSLFFIVTGFSSEQSYALSWEDLWSTQNQQGMKALDEGKTQEASQHFKDPQWKGYSQYQNGDYDAAIETLSKLNDADSAYNLGNALAKAGRLEEAIKAYDKALKKDPNNEDAQYNKEQIESLLNQAKEQSQQQNQGDQNQNPNEQQNSDQQNSNQQDANQQSQQNSQNSSEQQDQQDQQASNNSQDTASSQEEQQNQSDQQSASSSGHEESEKNKEALQQAMKEQSEDSTNEEEQDSHSTTQAQTSQEDQNQTDNKSEALQQAQLEASEPMTEQEQALEQWLRRVPDDPGGLLRRKFEYQYQQNQRNSRSSVTNQEEPLW